MSTALTQPDAARLESGKFGESLPWTALVWYGAVLAVCYWPILGGMVYQWQNDDDFSHGFFVPIIAAFIAWDKRTLWLGNPTRNMWGLALVAWGMIQLWAGSLGAELFLERSAFVISIYGLVLFYGGVRAVRVLGMPLFLLLFMIPIPGILYKQITFPLQLIASSLAETVLDLGGYLVLRDGNVLQLAGVTLSVAEACSGLRALHSLAFFSLSYGYLFDSRAWVRWTLFVIALPVAIVSNAGRIVVTAIVGKYNQELAVGVYHSMSGWILFVVAIGFLVGLHGLIKIKYGRAAA